MDLWRTDIKQQNKNVKRHFCFDNVNKYTMTTKSKPSIFEWCNLYRNSSGNCNARISFSLLLDLI